MSASLIGRLGSSTFRLSTTTVSMSLTGSCFSSESAPSPSCQIQHLLFCIRLYRGHSSLLQFHGVLISREMFLDAISEPALDQIPHMERSLSELRQAARPVWRNLKVMFVLFGLGLVLAAVAVIFF